MKCLAILFWLFWLLRLQHIYQDLGVVSSEKIKETSKIFKWFNCIAYSVLAALIARMVVFPAGELAESSIFIRLFVVTLCVLMFLFTKKNLVYPTVLSAILLSLLNSYL